MLRAGERAFIGNVAIFMGGRSAASAITFLLTPIISRLYVPEHFGAAALFMAAVGVVGPLACGGYEKAITVARTPGDARRLLALCLVLTVAVAMVTPLAVVAFSLIGVVPDALTQVGPLLWLMPAAIALEGAGLCSGTWLLRHHQFKRVAGAGVAQTGVRSSARVLTGFVFGSTVGALIWSYVVALVAQLLLLRNGITSAAPTGSLLGKGEKTRDLLRLARQYSDFPRYNMPTAFMMKVTAQMPIFVLGSVFGAEVVGFFAMADRVMHAPVNIAAESLRQVLQQKFAEIWNSNRALRAQLTKVVTILIVLGIVPLVVLVTSGEDLLAIVLGDRWRLAGRFVEIVAPSLLVLFVGAPFHAAMLAMRRQRLWFWLEMMTVIARFSIIPVAALEGITAETVLRVYVWTTVCTKIFAYVVVYLGVPRRHPGFADG